MPNVALLATMLARVSYLFHYWFIQPGNFSQIVQKFLFAQMRCIKIVGHSHHYLYTYLLGNRYLMGMQYGVVRGAFYIVWGWVHLLLKVLMPRVLVPEVLKMLVLGVLVPKVAVLGVLVPLSSWECICNLFKSRKWSYFGLDLRSE